MKKFKKTESGFVQLVILGVMAISVLSISVATNLVQKSQENRSKAAEGESTPILTLNEKAIALGVGQSYQLRAFLGPVDVTNSVTWSSNGTGISTVSSSGLVTVLMENASNYVTAKTSDGKEAVAQIFGHYSQEKADAVCGTANGGTFSSRPGNNLCQGEVATYGPNIEGNKYTWICVGANSGVSSNCEATINSLETNLSPTPTVTSTASKPRLYFEVTKGTYPVGENVEVSVSVDSASTRINGVDIVGNYDASKLELISIKQSQSFVFNGIGECVFPKSDLGKFIASCFINDSVNDRSALGKLITLVFKAKAVGKAEFSFDCVNKNTYDSNIIGPNSIEDIIACEQNMQMHIVVMPNDGYITPTRVPIPTKGSKIDGKCGTTKNSCVTGGFIDIADSSLYYMWKCKGVNGGATKVCSLKKTAKIDGKCGDTKNTCIAGKVDPLYGTLRSDRWRCIGLNGGKTINCLTWK